MGRRAGWALLVLFTALGCASSETTQVKDVAAGRFSCPREDLEAGLNRETPKVREYLVGCNFMYMRVQCRGKDCQPAKTPPPCVGDLPCFKEDPVTLEWKLEDKRTKQALRP